MRRFDMLAVSLALSVFVSLAASMTPAVATAAKAGDAPWGQATALEYTYAPQKVVYDTAARDEAHFEGVLDRVSFLNLQYGADPFDASIIVVLHGAELDYFARGNYARYANLMQRAHSLTQSGPIEFRICEAAARGRGYAPDDFHGFVQVIPMADAEIIRLQQEEGYAYMR